MARKHIFIHMQATLYTCSGANNSSTNLSLNVCVYVVVINFAY